jgi:hypothetical protein
MSSDSEESVHRKRKFTRVKKVLSSSDDDETEESSQGSVKLSIKEIDKIEREAERRRRNDAVRKRYVMEDASDEDDVSDDESLEEESSEEDEREERCDEDLSHASVYASIRDFEARLEMEDGSEEEERGEDHASAFARLEMDDEIELREDEDLSHDKEEDSSEDEDLESRERLKVRQILQDPDCCHNMSKSLRIVPGIDVKVDPHFDGYVYFFTAEMEGAALPQDTLKQILVLLHVIHSFIPEECILETEYLKASFDKQGGLEKLQKRVELTEEEARMEEERRQKLSSLPISEMPFDVPFVASTAPNEEVEGGLESSLMLKRQFRMEIVHVAEILLAPVFISHTTPDGHKTSDSDSDNNMRGSDKKVSAFMLTMLKTRKCYNFLAHLQWLVNSVDKEVRFFWFFISLKIAKLSWMAKL